MRYKSIEGLDTSSVPDSDCEFDEEESILLFEYFPNIETLDIANSKSYEDYIQYILATESKKCLNQIQNFLIQ